MVDINYQYTLCNCALVVFYPFQEKIINREYFNFDHNALTNYLYYHQIIKIATEEPPEKKQQPRKQKTLEELDQELYPRSTSMTMKYWDKTYEEVYRLDKYNSHHSEVFKRYVAMKDGK